MLSRESAAGGNFRLSPHKKKEKKIVEEKGGRGGGKEGQKTNEPVGGARQAQPVQGEEYICKKVRLGCRTKSHAS